MGNNLFCIIQNIPYSEHKSLLNNYQKVIVITCFLMEVLNHVQIHSINYIEFIR